MRKLFGLFVFFLAFVSVNAQTIPTGKCGLQCTYDNAGNLISREYVCMPVKNGTSTEPRALINSNSINKQESNLVKEIEAIYPNPTTGKFIMRFTLPLVNATITIMNSEGKVVKKNSVAGILVEVDLSGHPNGIYFISITDETMIITSQKIIKQ